MTSDYQSPFYEHFLDSQIPSTFLLGQLFLSLFQCLSGD